MIYLDPALETVHYFGNPELLALPAAILCSESTFCTGVLRMGPRLPVFVYLPVFCVFSVLGFGQQISSRPMITQPLVESQLTTLKGNTHPFAQPQFDIGPAPPDLPMNR